jgi:hypothetical protein
MLAAAAWSETIDNPYMPLLPGATYVYKGTTEGEAVKQRVVVQSYTKDVMSVTCTVVLDRVYISGELAEETHDYYAQDSAGTVWYFGEKSRDIEDGQVVSKAGSWLAGVNGAQPGIIMEAQPGVGDNYMQELATGVAEDQATVISFGGKAKTPFGNFSNCLVTQEANNLEPEFGEYKYYVAGIGQVKSQAFKGEQEILKLVSYIP